VAGFQAILLTPDRLSLLAALDDTERVLYTRKEVMVYVTPPQLLFENLGNSAFHIAKRHYARDVMPLEVVPAPSLRIGIFGYGWVWLRFASTYLRKMAL
jgi:hypothetical protein